MLFGKDKGCDDVAIQKLHSENLAVDRRQKVFVFKDSKSVYGAPIVFENRGMFLRAMMEEFPKGQAVWAKHPQDFSLYEIGDFNFTQGTFEPYEVKECVGLVADLCVVPS